MFSPHTSPTPHTSRHTSHFTHTSHESPTLHMSRHTSHTNRHTSHESPHSMSVVYASHQLSTRVSTVQHDDVQQQGRHATTAHTEQHRRTQKEGHTAQTRTHHAHMLCTRISTHLLHKTKSCLFTPRSAHTRGHALAAAASQRLERVAQNPRKLRCVAYAVW